MNALARAENLRVEAGKAKLGSPRQVERGWGAVSDISSLVLDGAKRGRNRPGSGAGAEGSFSGRSDQRESYRMRQQGRYEAHCVVYGTRGNVAITAYCLSIHVTRTASVEVSKLLYHRERVTGSVLALGLHAIEWASMRVALALGWQP